LALLEIPSSVTNIEKYAFQDCSSLTQLKIPSNVADVHGGAFTGVTRLERLTLVGSVLSRAVIAALQESMTPKARVVGAALPARKVGPFRFGSGALGRFTPGGGTFGRFTIEAC
jgi:hypothetical protein